MKYFLFQDDLLPALEVLNDGKDSRMLLSLGQTSPGTKVLNVPTQDICVDSRTQRIDFPKYALSPTIPNSKDTNFLTMKFV